jgi:trk system potassium uptake protein TrkH
MPFSLQLRLFVLQGLSTISLNDNFSLFGQLVVLFLIQVGGLGIMTLYSSMTLLLGRSMGMKEQVRMQGILDISSMEDLVAMIVDIVKYTLIIELWGAVILTIAFSFEGYEFGEALYYGFFHSISAFCNAGFALFNNSLENFSTNPLISGTIMILIILGGLGFIVLKECKAAIIERKSFILLSVHTRIVLITTAALIFLGTTVLFFSEFLHAFNDYSIFDKVLVSLFHSVTARTAGFNTIGLNSFHAHSLYLISLFMFIGASPGSTGGGIKTSTFAILVQSVRSTLRGRKDVEFFDRRIPSSLVVSSTAIIIISLTIVSFFLLVMMKIETEHSFITLFFEVISAFATTGLSLGITPYLTSAGKFIIVMLMFVGRVGPLTLALAIGQKSSIEGNLEYPESRVMIG